MLRVMVECDRYGYFLSRTGEVIEPAVFARRIGTEVRSARKLINELETAGMFSSNAGGEIFSRRLIREMEARAMASGLVRQGG
jgi:hypothetical protein